MWQDHGRRAPTTVSTGVSVLRAGPAHTKEDGLFIAPFAKQDQAPRAHVRIHVEAGFAAKNLRPGKIVWAPRLRRRKTNQCRKGKAGLIIQPKSSQKWTRRELVTGPSRNTSGALAPASWDPCRAPSPTETLEASIQRSRVLEPELETGRHLSSTGQRPTVQWSR